MLRSKHIGSQGILASIRAGYWVVRDRSEWMNTGSIKWLSMGEANRAFTVK